MKLDRANLIFQAAIDTFSEKGFDKATMDDIAARANVAKGTIYYHFKSKEDLFIFLVEEGMELLQEAVLSKVQDTMSGREKLEVLIREQLTFFGEYRDFCIIMLRESWGGEARQKDFRKMLRNYSRLIEEFIKQGVEEQQFQCDNPETAAWSVFGSAAITSLHVLLGRDPYDPQTLTKQLTRFAIHGLSPTE